jgi:hypothetical protein
MLLHARRKLYSISGGKVRTLHDRSTAGLISGFSISPDRFSFFSDRLSFFYKVLAAAHAERTEDWSDSGTQQHTIHEGIEMDIRFTATMLYAIRCNESVASRNMRRCACGQRDTSSFPTRDLISR